MKKNVEKNSIKVVAKAAKIVVNVTNSKKIRVLLTVIYVGIILYITVLSRRPASDRIFKGLFWEYKNGVWVDIILNITLFVPLGLLIGKFKFFHISVFLSAMIEGIQYAGKLGFCQLDDVLHNVTGFLLGCLIVHLFRYINASWHGVV